MVHIVRSAITKSSFYVGCIYVCSYSISEFQNANSCIHVNTQFMHLGLKAHEYVAFSCGCNSSFDISVNAVNCVKLLVGRSVCFPVCYYVCS